MAHHTLLKVGAGVSEQATAFMPGQLKITVSIDATFRSELTEGN